MNLDIIDCSSFHREFYVLINSMKANPYRESISFLKQAKSASNKLPIFVKQNLKNSSATLLKSCPQEPNIQEILTPQETSNKKSFISESCLAIISAQLGDVFAYIQVDDGELFHNITPKPGMENEQSYAGSLVELEFHTEQHFHPHSPDYLLLYCLRSVPDANTFFVDVEEVLKELDKKYIERLFKPIYKTGIDHVFGNMTTERGNGPIKPVLYGDHNRPYFRYDQDLMVGVTEEAKEALDELEIVLNRVKQSICLEPGELLVLDNRRVVHGRSLFKPKFDGKDRWLQRAKVKCDLGLVGSDCDLDTHIIETKFDI
ncbi:MAG: hypothetical protein COB99_04585 [Sulfurimonas sp.]|nr:MAG: hypothetical protein COB99_04585 [Sulfurimonas sp.]